MLSSMDLKIMDLAKESFLKLNIEEQHNYLISFLEEKFIYENKIPKEKYSRDDFINYLYDNNFIHSLDRSGANISMKVNTLEIEKHFNNTFANIVIPYIYSKYKGKLIKYFTTDGKDILQEMLLADIYIQHGKSDILKNKLKRHRENITNFEVDLMLDEILDLFKSRNLADIIDLSEKNLETLNINHEKVLKNTLIFCGKKTLNLDINLLEATEFLEKEFHINLSTNNSSKSSTI